jgi:hypothetical protein
MALSVEEIAGNPALYGLVRQQAQSMQSAYQSDPRLASVFASQQRWMMALAGLSLALRRDGPSRRPQTTPSRMFELVDRYGVASRNTTDAFLKELLHYKIIVDAPGSDDRRVRPFEPSESGMTMFNTWFLMHLHSLDGLDDGHRCAAYAADAAAVARIQPLVAERIVSTPELRQPQKTFSLFTWLNNGGVVMDWLFAGIDLNDIGAERISTGVLSISEFAAFLRLSRTHLDRKLREAERLGSLGWRGRRGHSVMWVSKDFFDEYAMAQAIKLSIFDAAYEECFSARRM